MGRSPAKHFLHSARNKVIAAFVLAAVAVTLAIVTTYFSFDTLLAKVDELAAPNEKLIRLNNLFEEITRLDQRQRADVLRQPDRAQRALKGQSVGIMASIDSLLVAPWESKQQVQRLQTVKRLFAKRNFYLAEYMTLRKAVISKQNQRQLDSLADLLMNAVPPPDTSVTTTQQKTTTTTYLGEPEKKGNFFSRLFGGKKKEEAGLPLSEVKEEVSTRIDTLALHRPDSTIQQLTRLLKTLEETQQQQSKRLLQRELELANANMVLVTQVLSILRDLEAEEILTAQRNNTEALQLVKASTRTIGTIMIVFFLLAAVLVFLILTDISKSNYYRLQLEKAKAEAERLGKVKQRFLSNMSHEIRTPLQSIIGFSEQLPDQAGPHVHHIRQASRHLLQIVNEVLDLNRLASDTLKLENAPFLLPQVVNEVARSAAVLAQSKKLPLEVVTDHLSPVWVRGDAFRLKQMLYNLLSNAIKFTDTGKVVLDVRAKVDLLVVCEFVIADTGIGMTPAETEKIFDEFEQAHAGIAERFGGSGLGLAIVKRLVDLCQGELDVRSEPGQGSTFTVRMSFERSAEPALQTAPMGVAPKANGTVAVVDDDALIVRLCETIFQKHGLNFMLFTDARELRQADLSQVSVALIDIRMPGLSGTDVAKMMRAQAPAARLIAFTAHALPEEQDALLRQGFHDILLKPFLEADLLAKLNAPPTHTVVSGDMDALQSMLGNDATLIHEVLSNFCTDTAADLKRLSNEDERAMWREVIHRLAGRTGQLGFYELHAQLIKAEAQMAAGHPLTDHLRKYLIEKVTALLASLSPRVSKT